MGLVQRLMLVELVAVGAFFLYLAGLAYSGGFAPPPYLVWLIVTPGVSFLLTSVAAFLGPPEKVDRDMIPRKSSFMWLTVIVIGLVLTFTAELIAFPVGCNLTPSCPADPIGAWSTIWPNALVLNSGIAMVAGGYGKGYSRSSSLEGLGYGLIIGGGILISFGWSVGYFTSCPGNGCQPLTGDAWWSLFWPNAVAQAVGAVQVASGFVIAFFARRSIHSSLRIANRTEGGPAQIAALRLRLL